MRLVTFWTLVIAVLALSVSDPARAQLSVEDAGFATFCKDRADQYEPLDETWVVCDFEFTDFIDYTLYTYFDDVYVWSMVAAGTYRYRVNGKPAQYKMANYVNSILPGQMLEQLQEPNVQFVTGNDGAHSAVWKCFPAKGVAAVAAKALVATDSGNLSDFDWSHFMRGADARYIAKPQNNCTPYMSDYWEPQLNFDIFGDVYNPHTTNENEWSIIVNHPNGEDIEVDDCDDQNAVESAIASAFNGHMLSGGSSSSSGQINGWGIGFDYTTDVKCMSEGVFRKHTFSVDFETDENGDFTVNGVGGEVHPAIPEAPAPQVYDWWWNTTCFGPVVHTTNEFVVGLDMGFLSWSLRYEDEDPGTGGPCFSYAVIGGE